MNLGIMNTAQIKQKLHQFIDKSDERFLRMMHAMAQEYSHEKKGDIAGYKPDGSPITKQELIARAQESEKAIEEGRAIDFKDFEKEIESW